MHTDGSVPFLLQRAALVWRGAIWAAAVSAAVLAGGAHARATKAGLAEGTLAFGPVSANFTSLSAGAGTTLTATPSTISFGSVPVGTSNSQAVQLKNTGTTNLTISAWAVSKTEFQLKGLTTPLVLAPGKTASCTLVYTPKATGHAAASTSITSTASNKTLTLAISGTGVAATRILTATPAILNFGNESTGNTHTLTVSLKNSGNSSVTVSGISVLATDMATGGGVSGATIAPGQTATVRISFSPKKVGTVSGSVKIASNATDATMTIVVSGVGVSSSGHSVALSWQASISPNVTGYYVYRASGLAGAYSKLVTAALSGLKYTDSSVISGETYRYAVTAADSFGRESATSSPVTAVIP